MPLSEMLKDYLAGECEIVSRHILETDTPRDKLYYFSAVFGAAQRVLNIEFSRSVVLLQVVSTYTHSALIGRLNDQSLPPLTDSYFEQLAAVVQELGSRLRHEQDYSDLVEHIATLGYAVTGNGHYLGITGRLH